MSSTDDGTNGKFGITEIYPAKPNGQGMNMDDPRNDSCTNEPSISKNAEGSWRVTSGQVRFGVNTYSGFHPGQVVKNHATLASRGYMQEVEKCRDGGTGQLAKRSLYFQVITKVGTFESKKQNLRYLILQYDHMLHVSELQWSELDPKLFSESWIILIHIVGKVCWTETHYPLMHDILVRLIMTKEIAQ